MSYSELSDLLRRLGHSDSAAGFHGVLCGCLCVTPGDDLSLRALLDADAQDIQVDAEAEDVFDRLRESSRASLLSPNMDFAPMLPDDDWSLADRAQALASWCGGFLFGLASQHSLDLEKSSDEARELIQDLGKFTQAGSAIGADDEMEETALAELIEYVRVGAQLLFMEFHPRGSGAEPKPRQVH
ncbi:MAG: UPF0149 family protein [Panacagrimonas sp.]